MKLTPKQKEVKPLKLSKKHLEIFRTILFGSKGYYKPTYSDKEPATQTLINAGLIDWRTDFRGVILTEQGKEYIKTIQL
jgi:hypothetical protein